MTDKEIYDALTKAVKSLKLVGKSEILNYLKRTAPEQVKFENSRCDCCCYDCCSHI